MYLKKRSVHITFHGGRFSLSVIDNPASFESHQNNIPKVGPRIRRLNLVLHLIRTRFALIDKSVIFFRNRGLDLCSTRRTR